MLVFTPDFQMVGWWSTTKHLFIGTNGGPGECHLRGGVGKDDVMAVMTEL